MTSPKTILVTGCAGFIGSNFVRGFRESYPHTTIVGIDDLSSGRKDALLPEVVFYKGSIVNERFLEEIFSHHKPEYVFHFAALPRVSYSIEHPQKTSEVNVVGTVALLEMSRKHGVTRFINSSTSSVYGGAKILPTKESENPRNPQSPYAAQKCAGEDFCRIYSSLHGLDTVSLRYFNVFGPGQYGTSAYSTVISGLLEALYFPKNKVGFIEGDGKQSRDFCYIDNVVYANVRAMEAQKPLHGEAINIGHGERITVREVIRRIEEYTEQSLVLEQRPARKGDVRHTCADISRAKRLIGYKPLVSFADGLQRTVNWFEGRQAGLWK